MILFGEQKWRHRHREQMYGYQGRKKRMEGIGRLGLTHLQSYLTLLRPYGLYSLPGSSVHGILQERILEWVTMPSSRGSSQSRDQTQVSYVFCIDRRVLYH